MDIDVRRATTNDLPEAIDILAECSAWLKAKGIAQWPDRFPESILLTSIEKENLFVATDSGETVATITLQWADAMF
jgi:hypothetical protein